VPHTSCDAQVVGKHRQTTRQTEQRERGRHLLRRTR
jgi:hypothetical protein